MRFHYCWIVVVVSTTITHADVTIHPRTDADVPRATSNSHVQVQHLNCDKGGTTSLRFQVDKSLKDNKFPPDSVNRNRIAGPDQRKVQSRDRDLGQTFLTGDTGYTVDSIYLRLGFSEKFALAGAHGAKVALQFMEVHGSPKLNDSGTPGDLGKFDRLKSPELDDFLEGETYTPLHTTTVVALPNKLEPGMVLQFQLTGKDAVKLKPNGHYAFLLLFTERGKDRALALANSFRGSYQPDPKNKFVGHGIRREGGSGKVEVPFFRPDLPDDLEARTKQQPGTLGFPDVCTYRDLYFTITAVQGSETKR